MIDTLRRITDTLDRYAPLLVYGVGLLFIGAAVFDLPLVQVAFEFPRGAALIWGVLLWVAGSEARSAQKRARQAERELEATREHQQAIEDVNL